MNEELIDSMVFNVLIEIVNQYTDADALDFVGEVELGNFIKDELAFGKQGLEEAIDEVWEEAKENVCYGNAEYWEEEYQMTPLATEMLLNKKAIQKAILKQIKEYCL